MDILFLSFANHHAQPLATLQEEDDALQRLLAPRAKEGHFVLHRDSFVTLEKLPAYLSLYRDNLVVFLFSGHAGRDHLLLPDGTAHAAGLAGMLGMCPKLKFVFLNGCSTQGQVNALLDAGVGVVIATSAPVEDRKAAFFSIRFFEALQQQFSVIDAFKMAKSALETIYSDIKPEVYRGAVRLPSAEQPTWGIHFTEKSEHLLDWRLPAKSLNTPIATNFIPNQYLIDTLFKSLAPYSEQLNSLNKQDSGLSKVSQSLKRMAILNALPAPLAEPLRKLIVPVELENEGYDKVSIARIEQIVKAYHTSMELLVFTMLAQLWEAYDVAGQLEIQSSQQAELGQFIIQSRAQRADYDLVKLVSTIKDILDQNKIRYFVQELDQATALLEEDPVFAEALRFLNSLHVQMQQSTLDSQAIIHLCQKGEECLAYFYAQLGFLTRYRLATIQSIDVEKYRHRRTPSYNHATVVLHDLLGGFDLSPVKLDKSLDNRSILLINDQNWEYLNLTPFVLDENAFHKDTDICKLYFFSHYQKGADLLFYKYVNKPDDPMLEVPGTQFQLIREQFDAFTNLLLNKPLAAL